MQKNYMNGNRTAGLKGVMGAWSDPAKIIVVWGKFEFHSFPQPSYINH